jgi:DNA-binding FadR family transcriptional regulator
MNRSPSDIPGLENPPAAQNAAGEKMPVAVTKKIQEPGARLRETDLAKQFAMSRSPIREALWNLEKQGTVTIEPFKGATIVPFSAAEAV